MYKTLDKVKVREETIANVVYSENVESIHFNTDVNDPDQFTIQGNIGIES